MYNVCGIYKITSPNKKIYIGQSKNIHQRFIRYKRGDCEGQKRLYNSIKKYGWINHSFEIILECIEDKLNEMKIYYIDLFQTFNTKFGMNLKGGGSNGNLSDESKAKISNSLKGRPVSEETRAKIRASLTGKKHSEKTKIKMSKPRTEEHKANISAGKIGKKHQPSCLGAVIRRSEQLFCVCEIKKSTFQLDNGTICCCKCEKERAK